VETPLAERIVSLMWRLKRAQRLQNEVFDYFMAKDAASSCLKSIRSTSAGDPSDDPDFVLGRVVARDLSNSRVIERLGLYERRIESSLYRTMRELRTVKALRACETTEKAGNRRSACRGAAEDEVGRAGIKGPVAAPLRPDTLPLAPADRELCETNPICPGVEGREGREEHESILVGTGYELVR
jgi:hypothetical protein